MENKDIAALEARLEFIEHIVTPEKMDPNTVIHRNESETVFGVVTEAKKILDKTTKKDKLLESFFRDFDEVEEYLELANSTVFQLNEKEIVYSSINETLETIQNLITLDELKDVVGKEFNLPSLNINSTVNTELNNQYLEYTTILEDCNEYVMVF